MIALTWEQVRYLLQSIPKGYLWGIPRGGAIIAGLTGMAVDKPEDADIIVDDIIVTGKTRDRYAHLAKDFFALIDKNQQCPFLPTGKLWHDAGWIVFPWEADDTEKDILETVVRQLEHIGEDPMRDGLINTPQRVIKALREMTSGYAENTEAILATTFDVSHDEMVILKNIAFSSLCEHHMLPFTGEATVGYLPGDRIVGLSKLARLVHAHAKRLQVQERMTQDIASDLMRYLSPKGVGVVVKATHMCMSCRGIKLSGAEMITSAMLGKFRECAVARAEFISFATQRHT